MIKRSVLLLAAILVSFGLGADEVEAKGRFGGGMGDASPNLSKPLGTNLGADEVEAKGRFGGGMGDASPNLSKTLGTKKASPKRCLFVCPERE